MPTSTYRIDGNHPLGGELKASLQSLSDAFSKIKNLRLALIQMKDGSTGTKTDFVTMVSIVGYMSSNGSPDDGTVAMASFAEIDSFVGNATAALEQCVARHKQ